jgi:hypothetical protein
MRLGTFKGAPPFRCTIVPSTSLTWCGRRLLGEPWYQSDHGLFIQHHRPALAITSERFMELTTYITHTPKDRPEIVDMNKLVLIAMALRDLLLSLNRYLS